MSKKNFTISTVATAPDPATTGTSLVVESGHGARFADDEPAIIFPAGEQPDSTNAEVVMVTNIVTDTLTITREQESTTARTIIVGDVIIQGITAKDWNDLAGLATHSNRADLDNVSGTNTGDSASIPVGYLDTDGTLAGNSDTKVPSQKAVKTYADTKIPKTTNITALNETGIADGEVAVFNLTNKDIRTSNTVISTDGTFAGNADTNIPTEKAVKTYVDNSTFTWKGAWATSTSYLVNDSVENDGSGYVCTQANTSGATTEPGVGASWTDYWDLFVEGFDPAKAETLTNKTIDGDDNTIQDLAYSSIKSTSRSGSDTTLITGTKGTNGDLAQWNVDGDLVDGPTPPSGTIVGTTDAQTLTNKTLTNPTVNFTDKAVTQNVSFMARLSENFAMATGTFTLIPFATELWDIGGDYTNTANNYKFTAPVAGYYLVQLQLAYMATSTLCYARIYKNGSLYNFALLTLGGGASESVGLTVMMSLSQGDYLQAYGRQNSGGNVSVENGGHTFFGATLLHI